MLPFHHFIFEKPQKYEIIKILKTFIILMITLVSFRLTFDTCTSIRAKTRKIVTEILIKNRNFDETIGILI